MAHLWELYAPSILEVKVGHRKAAVALDEWS